MGSYGCCLDPSDFFRLRMLGSCTAPPSCVSQALGCVPWKALGRALCEAGLCGCYNSIKRFVENPAQNGSRGMASGYNSSPRWPIFNAFDMSLDLLWFTRRPWRTRRRNLRVQRRRHPRTGGWAGEPKLSWCEMVKLVDCSPCEFPILNDHPNRPLLFHTGCIPTSLMTFWLTFVWCLWCFWCLLHAY